jgi:CheY-like chemotaxis protein
VAVSASSLEHERTFYLAQGFQEFIGKPYIFEDVCKALQHYTQVNFEVANELTTTENTLDDVHVNLLSAKPVLQALAAAAASGDMSASKKIIGNLSIDQLGKQRHHQLVNALRQYDLEKVEALSRSWLIDAEG